MTSTKKKKQQTIEYSNIDNTEIGSDSPTIVANIKTPIR